MTFHLLPLKLPPCLPLVELLVLLFEFPPPNDLPADEPLLRGVNVLLGRVTLLDVLLLRFVPKL